jgi:hypothetical protein
LHVVELALVMGLVLVRQLRYWLGLDLQLALVNLWELGLLEPMVRLMDQLVYQLVADL